MRAANGLCERPGGLRQALPSHLVTREQQPPHPGPRDEDPGSPAPWQGAPGYVPPADLPPASLMPHAPMPGAPPYPAAVEQPPTPIGRGRARTSLLDALVAGAAWAAVNLVLTLVVVGSPPPQMAGRFIAGLATTTVLAGLAGWFIARRRNWSFWMLLLVVAPIFWLLRTVTLLVIG